LDGGKREREQESYADDHKRLDELPSLLSKTTRDADWYKSNFAEKMAGVCLSACYS